MASAYPAIFVGKIAPLIAIGAGTPTRAPVARGGLLVGDTSMEVRIPNVRRELTWASDPVY